MRIIGFLMFSLVLIIFGCPKEGPRELSQEEPSRWVLVWQQELATKPSGDWYDLSRDHFRTFLNVITIDGKILSIPTRNDHDNAVCVSFEHGPNPGIVCYRMGKMYRYLIKGPFKNGLKKVVEKE